MKIKHSLPEKIALILLGILSACAVGPDYVKPTVEVPPAYKEQVKNGVKWKQAQPKDTLWRGTWWKILSEWEESGDPELNALEMQIDISNQNIKQAEANFRQSQAAISQAQAAFFPQVGAGYSDMRGNSQPTTDLFGFQQPGVIANNYTASLSASWEVDVWGKIRRTVESKDASSEATSADLQSARFSAQAELATDYVNLRFIDEQQRLLDTTAANDEKTLQLTENLYASGIGRRLDVVQARQKLESVKAQALDTGVQRAQYEHAIALLIGKAPASFSIAPSAYVPLAPEIPASVPSELLERRPDIASAERKAAAANAQIGVAEAAFFPSLKLDASVEFQSNAFEHFGQLFAIPQRFWSIGPSVNAPLIDGGAHSAQKEAAVAAYDQAVAAYRHAVLSGFKDVEDNLAAQRILEKEAAAQQKSVAASLEAKKLALSLYTAGSGRYSDVLTAQNEELNSEVSALNTEKQRVLDAVALIKALGGGWDGKPSPEPSPSLPIAEKKGNPDFIGPMPKQPND